MPNSLRIVFIGDVCGKYGRSILKKSVPLIRAFMQPDLVIVNGENSAGGLGITKATAQELFDSDIDIITGGNHIWDKKEAVEFIDKEPRIVRPGNYPEGIPGNGSVLLAHHKAPCLIINVLGRVFMDPVADNPFTYMDKVLKEYDAKVIFVDFHAEATAEKQTMGFFLDGRVSAVLGTHTHVPTADLRILAKGTAYQTDVGMTGSLDSVIGMRYEPILQRFLTGINQKFEVASENLILDATLMDIDIRTGRTQKARSFRLRDKTVEEQLVVIANDL